MNTKKFEDLYFFHPKSKVPASDGMDEGKFPFYTSSAALSKRIDKADFNTVALIFGTGGSASIHYVDGQFNVSTDCFVAASKQDELNIKYTYYYLLYNLHLLERGFKGAGLKHISKRYIEKLSLTYPDLETQNKIVAILDKANSIIEKREEAIEKCDELLRSTFLEMFLKFQGTNVQKLDDVAYVVSGLTKGKKYNGRTTSLYPYMRVANVQDGYLVENTLIAEIQKAYGTMAKKVQQRLDDIEASPNLKILMQIPAANCHPLSGDMQGEWALDISGNHRMIFDINHDPVPQKDTGGVDTLEVTDIRIIDTTDYH